MPRDSFASSPGGVAECDPRGLFFWAQPGPESFLVVK